MMPGLQLSKVLEYGPFLPPDGLPQLPTLSYQLGGIGISDPSAGLEYQVWTAVLVDAGLPTAYVQVSAPNTPPTTILTLADITWISLAFDQNMKPALAYMANGSSYLWWYDATIPGYSTVTLPTAAHSPQITFDDKRTISVDTAVSDIVLAYLLGTNMYMRQQRDRFTIDYLLTDQIIYVNPTLYKVGMCSTDRLLFQVNGNI